MPGPADSQTFGARWLSVSPSMQNGEGQRQTEAGGAQAAQTSAPQCGVSHLWAVTSHHTAPHPSLGQPGSRGILGQECSLHLVRGTGRFPYMKKSPHQDYSPLASRHDSQDLDQGSTGAPQTKLHSTQLKTSLGFCKGCICPQAGHVPSSPGSPSPLSVYNLRLHKANPNRTGP